mgnify:CR=1 FL=1
MINDLSVLYSGTYNRSGLPHTEDSQKGYLAIASKNSIGSNTVFSLIGPMKNGCPNGSFSLCHPFLNQQPIELNATNYQPIESIGRVIFKDGNYISSEGRIAPELEDFLKTAKCIYFENQPQSPYLPATPLFMPKIF